MADKNSKKESGFKKFLNQNKSLAIMLPVFVVLIGIVLYMYVFSDMGKTKPAVASKPPAETQKAIVTTAVNNKNTTGGDTDVFNFLPVRERALSDGEVQNDPFTTQYQLKGIVYSEKGTSCCVITAKGKSYILEENQSIESVLTVLEINKSNVRIKNTEGKEIILSILN